MDYANNIWHTKPVQIKSKPAKKVVKEDLMPAEVKKTPKKKTAKKSK